VILKAENPHELMRCLEAKAIVDNARVSPEGYAREKGKQKIPF